MAAPIVIASQSLLTVSPEDGTSKFGSEFDPFTAGLPNGGFVAVWDDFLPQAGQASPNYPYAIDPDGQNTTMIRFFKQDGSAAGIAQPVSGNLVGDYGYGEVVTLSNGKVAVAWDAGDSSGTRVSVRIFDPATGMAAGSEVTVTGPGLFTGMTVMQNGLVALSDGRAGLLYVNRDTAPAQNQLRLLIVDSDGVQASDTVLLQQTPSTEFLQSLGGKEGVTVLAGPNADVIAVVTRSPLNNNIGVNFYNTDGTLALPSLALGNNGGYEVSIAGLPNGGLAIAFQLPGGFNATTTLMRVLMTDATGVLQGSPVDLTFNGAPFGGQELLALPDGDLLVATATGGALPAILVQRLNGDGTLDGSATQIGTIGDGYTRPQLALAGDGTVVMTFENNGDVINATRLDLGLPGTITGGASADRLTGYSGNDSISGGLGIDTLSGGNGNDTLIGGGARDFLYGEAGHDKLEGGQGGDVLDGGLGRDTLLGGNGNDILRGGVGSDRLIGGQGNDTLIGGYNSDVFVFSRTDSGGTDLISGWQAGDRIDFDGLGTVSFLGSGPFTGGADAAVRVYTTTTDTFIEVDTADADAIANFVIRINSVVNLSASDFILT